MSLRRNRVKKEDVLGVKCVSESKQRRAQWEDARSDANYARDQLIMINGQCATVAAARY